MYFEYQLKYRDRDRLLVHSAKVYKCYCVSVVQCSVVPLTIHIFTQFFNILREIKIGMPTLGRGNGNRLETMDDVTRQFKIKFSHNDQNKEYEEIVAANLKTTLPMMESTVLRVLTSSQD